MALLERLFITMSLNSMNDKSTFRHPQPQSNEPAQGQIAGAGTTQDQQIAYLTSQVTQLQAKRINFNTDILGLFESLTAAPTGVPTGPYGQLKIAKISGTTYLYIYDYNQQAGGSGSNGWFRVAIT